MKVACFFAILAALGILACGKDSKELAGTVSVSADKPITLMPAGEPSDFTFAAESNTFTVEGGSSEQEVKVVLTAVPQQEFIQELNKLDVGIEIANPRTKILETMTLELGEPEQIITFNKDIEFAVDTAALTSLKQMTTARLGASKALAVAISGYERFFSMAVVSSSDGQQLGTVACEQKALKDGKLTFTCKISGSGKGPKISFAAFAGDQADVAVAIGPEGKSPFLFHDLKTAIALILPTGTKKGSASLTTEKTSY